VDNYGQRCREAREKAGYSLAEARDLLRDTIPHRYVPSVKTLARIETGETPEHKVDGIVIYGLAKVYGCKVSELSKVVADELERVSDLLMRSTRCIAA
jgi:transcriptional regulator with XRE-family HTH domain